MNEQTTMVVIGRKRVHLSHVEPGMYPFHENVTRQFTPIFSLNIFPLVIILETKHYCCVGFIVDVVLGLKSHTNLSVLLVGSIYLIADTSAFDQYWCIHIFWQFPYLDHREGNNTCKMTY